MKVLVAIDGSSYTDMCIQAAKKIALPADTSIIITTVVPEHTFLDGLRFIKHRSASKSGDNFRQKQEQAAGILLEKGCPQLQSIGFDATPMVKWGKPTEQILNVVHEQKPQLVIIGAKGSTNSDHFQLGSVAGKIMKHAGCNVLLVKEWIEKVRRVFLATDGSPHSAAALDFLLDLSFPSRVEYFLLTVLQSHVEAYLSMPTLNMDDYQQMIADLQKGEEKAARKLLNEIEKRCREKGFGVTPMLRRGEPSHEIINCANAFNPELVAVGSRGLGAVEGFLMGSVAQRVARHSRYSVLIVRK